MKPEQRLLDRALAREADAHRLLLDGDAEGARAALLEVAELYRRSWEVAPPQAFGRLIGMLKAAVLAGGGEGEAAFVRRELGAGSDSPVAAYALALAALVEGDDPVARREASRMRTGGDAFERTADAVESLADRDGKRYGAATKAIVADFESREEHVTGVPIADTALMLERIAAGRGMAAGITSPLLPDTLGER